ncbi:MAG: DUF2442 domain-containing protein [Odoribacter sp.]
MDITIKRLWFKDENIFLLTDDGRTLWQSLLWYPRLKNATKEERDVYTVNKFGLRWASIDEDMSFESFAYDDPEPRGISRLFLTHPELNVSAIARRMGMKQSLLAQYINGTKKPSSERENEIIESLRSLGQELIAL